ncbi:unnamed protein product, partial [Mesorhabditis spiculigera]
MSLPDIDPTDAESLNLNPPIQSTNDFIFETTPPNDQPYKGAYFGLKPTTVRLTDLVYYYMEFVLGSLGSYGYRSIGHDVYTAEEQASFEYVLVTVSSEMYKSMVQCMPYLSL